MFSRSPLRELLADTNRYKWCWPQRSPLLCLCSAVASLASQPRPPCFYSYSIATTVLMPRRQYRSLNQHRQQACNATPADTIQYLQAINPEDLAVKRAREQSGRCGQRGGWLGQIRIACSLRSFAVSSCSCCIDSSIKMQEDPLRVDWSSRKSGTHRNSHGVRGERITP